jgi:hypothetical protein
LNTRVRTISFSLIFVVTIFATYHRAELDGFLRGKSLQTIESAKSEALTNVVALEMLRRGDSEKAIKALEIGLDSAIYAHGLNHSLDVSPPWLASEINIDPENEAMTRVAKYRNIYPSQEGNPEIKKLIETTVEQYLK